MGVALVHLHDRLAQPIQQLSGRCSLSRCQCLSSSLQTVRNATQQSKIHNTKDSIAKPESETRTAQTELTGKSLWQWMQSATRTAIVLVAAMQRNLSSNNWPLNEVLQYLTKSLPHSFIHSRTWNSSRWLAGISVVEVVQSARGVGAAHSSTRQHVGDGVAHGTGGVGTQTPALVPRQVVWKRNRYVGALILIRMGGTTHARSDNGCRAH